MERTSLQQIANLLDTLASGKWLQQQLIEYAPPAQQPHVLVLLSAPRSLQQVFPEGSQLDPSWHIWPEGEELSLPVVEQADLIIWLMPALRLFPGEYVLALEQARKQAIPIWAIVVGLERLSDENSFLHQRLPKYRASLPTGSQFFLLRPNMRVPLHVMIVQALDKEGTDILKRGDERRLKTLTARLKEQIQQDRQVIAQKLNKAEQFANTAKAGVSSIKILTSATTTAMLREYSALHYSIEMLKNELLDKTVLEGVHEPLDMLPEIFIGAIHTWRRETFEPTLQAKRANAEAHLQTWYEEYTQEITEFFRFSDSLDGSTPSTTSEFPVEQCTRYLDGLQKNIWQSFERFLKTFSYSIQSVCRVEVVEPERSEEEYPIDEPRSHYADHQYEQHPNTTRNVSFSRSLGRLIENGRRVLSELSNPAYDDEQQRKEVLQEIVHQHVEWFIGELLTVVQQQQKPLTLFLEGMQSTWGDKRLEHIQATLTTPQEQLALIAETERLLRGVL